MAAKLDTVVVRDRLEVRREPHWHRLDAGCTLGFRRMTAGSPGTWIARYRNPETGERPKLALGDFGDIPESQRFGAAKRAAEAWFLHLGRGGSSRSVTVREACEQYVEHIRAERGDQRAKEVAARFRRLVFNQKIADIPLTKLSRSNVDAWRRKLVGAPVVVNPHADESDRITRARAPSSVNRDMTALRAALNRAHDMGAVTTDAAWRVALRPSRNADRQRNAYLDRDQRAALIGEAPPDVAAFLRALSLVPLRPGAIAALTVASLDKRLGVLVIGKDKSGGDRKIKLPAATTAFFAEQSKDKLPAAPLLARADGKAWDKDAWKKPVKAAAAAAKLPSAITAYALRHSAITDLIGAGLDVLTVARLSGTSVAMIEKHYGHLRADHAAAALGTLAL